MKNLYVLIVLVIMSLQSCAPSMNAEWNKPGYQKKPAKNILVIALAKGLEARQSVEGSIVSELQNKYQGYTYYTGLELFPPNLNKGMTEEGINKIIEEKGIELVLSTSFVKAYNNQVYVPGDGAYVPYYYNIGRQIYSTWDIISTPGYYENVENFVLVSNLYDLREGNTKESAMVWQGESEVTAPGSIRSGAYDYADNLVRYLYKNDILPNN